MNKKEAAAFLEVSERAIERYTASGKLHPAYVKGRTGQAPDFDESELQQLKQQMQQQPTTGLKAISDKPDKAATALTRRGAESRNELIQLLAEAIRPQSGGVEIKDKLVLTLAEAEALSGVSEASLKAAIHSGKLKAILNELGRGYRIKRTDLDAYIKKL